MRRIYPKAESAVNAEVCGPYHSNESKYLAHREIATRYRRRKGGPASVETLRYPELLKLAAWRQRKGQIMGDVIELANEVRAGRKLSASSAGRLCRLTWEERIECDIPTIRPINRPNAMESLVLADLRRRQRADVQEGAAQRAC
jgi:hypothetical protein